MTAGHVTLCFHGVGEPGRALEDGEERFWITDSRLDEILDVVVDHPRRPELTFDDANASDVAWGLPALLSRGLTATFFVITDRIDQPGSLTSTDVADLYRAGMRVGTHGSTHRPWRSLARSGELAGELTRSSARLAELTDRPVTDAAPPRGDYDRAVLQTLRRHGFTRVYTVDEGSSSTRSWLRTRRTVIYSDDAGSVADYLDHPHASSRQRALHHARTTAKRWR